MALAAIYSAVTEDVLMMLAEKDSAKEARETLRTMHMGADRVKEAKVQTLRSNFEVIRMKNDESVDDFSMRLNIIVTGIHLLDLKTMTVEEVVGRLKTHEERLKGFGAQGEPSLLLTHAEWSSQSNRADEKDSSNSSKEEELVAGALDKVEFMGVVVILIQAE
nr:hypothetical protein [Tanacetum cinerariifolium]